MTPLKLHYAVGDVTANSRGSKPKKTFVPAHSKNQIKRTHASAIYNFGLSLLGLKKIPVVIYAKYDISKIEKKGGTKAQW